MLRVFFSPMNHGNGIPALWRKWPRPILAAGLGTALCLTAFAGLAGAQRDARVLHRNLPELVGDSYTIVLGRVVSVKAEPHPQLQNLQTLVVTLQVSEVWKGQAGSTFTFRAFVSHPLDFKEKLGYAGDQDVLLMLTRPSDIGLSSPAGLEQGRFRVSTDAHGNRTVVNGLNNAGLFRNVQKTAPKLDAQLAALPARQLLTQHASGPIAFDDFKTIVQTLVAGSQQ
ncbi:MAG: hypothetical protein HYR58_07435 [Acidobacteria bacterium]|nr:hypothetical protein [Acidobacteriota bacterium]